MVIDMNGKIIYKLGSEYGHKQIKGNEVSTYEINHPKIHYKKWIDEMSKNPHFKLIEIKKEYY